ncbi:MAG: hypothetical protein ACRDDZ_11795 [Marinifilaceae bacterium]
MKRFFSLIVFLLHYTFLTHGQFVSFGQDPSWFRWKQIRTENFQLIYPDFFEDNAQKMANLFHNLYQHANKNKKNVRSISIILHAGEGLSNGNVAMAPRKSELYTIPAQEPSDGWLAHLCAHEFRHVVQIDQVDQGITKAIYYVFGDIFPTLVIGLYVPMWYMEGDAVAFESAVLPIGRGRSPEFLNEMKAQVVEKGVYSMQKAILGSNKDFVPNRYVMGYYMVSNTRANYGKDIWDKALRRCGNRPFGITPFATSLKMSMSKKRDSLWQSPKFESLFIDPQLAQSVNTHPSALRTLYHDNFSQLQAQWVQEIHNNQYSHFDTIPTNNKNYTNYHYPLNIGTNSIIAYKEGIDQTGMFVLIKDGREIPIVKTAKLYDYQFAYKDSVIVWCEYIPHIRWEHAGRNTLASYNMKTGTYKHHPMTDNCFAPFAFDEGWGCIVVNSNNQASIVSVDNDFLSPKTRYTAPNYELILHPSVNDSIISCVTQTADGLQLAQINWHTEKRINLTPVVNYQIDFPTLIGNTTFYRSATSGNNAIHIKRGLETVNQVLSTPFGCNYPTISADSSLLFSFYTSNGYKPGRVRLSDLSYSRADYEPYTLAETVTKQENWQLNVDSDSSFHTKPFRKATNLFNIHSWGPAVIDFNNQAADLGLALYSQNLLSTLFLSAGYALQSGFKYGQWFVDASYQGLFPIFDLKLESGRYKYDNYNLHAQLNNSDETDTLFLKNKAWLSSARLMVRAPLNFSRRNYIRYFQPFISYKVEGVHNNTVRKTYKYITDQEFYIPVDKRNYSLSQPRRFYQMLEYGFQISNRMRQSQQELWPKLAQSFQIGYGHTPLNYINYGPQWWTTLNTYFPTPVPLHSLQIYSGFQRMQNKVRNYNNKVMSPRGTELYGYEMFSLRSTYQLPLVFSDWSVGSTWYIKNLTAGAFFDYGYEKQVLKNHSFNSYGVELKSASYLVRLPFEITAGFRVGYETKHHNMFGDLILSVGVSL